MVDKFTEDAKPSAWQRMGVKIKPAKTKAIEVLNDSVETDFTELRASIDNLEEKWKESHGPVCRGLDIITYCSNIRVSR